tara:strand:- start:218 stop:589 length:372 start_codon:yes stop_codon:yes gene_type:complete
MQDFTKAEYLNAIETGALTSNYPSAWILRSMLHATPYMKPIHLRLHMIALRKLYRIDKPMVARDFIEALKYHHRSADMTDGLSSARVCLDDAESCYQLRNYASAIRRAIRGFEYLGYTHISRA